MRAHGGRIDVADDGERREIGPEVRRGVLPQVVDGDRFDRLGGRLAQHRVARGQQQLVERAPGQIVRILSAFGDRRERLRADQGDVALRIRRVSFAVGEHVEQRRQIAREAVCVERRAESIEAASTSEIARWAWNRFGAAVRQDVAARSPVPSLPGGSNADCRRDRPETKTVDRRDALHDDLHPVGERERGRMDAAADLDRFGQRRAHPGSFVDRPARHARAEVVRHARGRRAAGALRAGLGLRRRQHAHHVGPIEVGLRGRVDLIDGHRADQRIVVRRRPLLDAARVADAVAQPRDRVTRIDRVAERRAFRGRDQVGREPLRALRREGRFDALIASSAVCPGATYIATCSRPPRKSTSGNAPSPSVTPLSTSAGKKAERSLLMIEASSCAAAVPCCTSPGI